VLANSDVLLQMTFVNSLGAPTQPTSIQYRIDSLTIPQNVRGWTSVTPTGSQQILQLPGTLMVPTQTWFGRELWQVWIQAVLADSNATSGNITVNKLVVLDLVAESTPS
jgi:hypothetical protein